MPGTDPIQNLVTQWRARARDLERFAPTVSPAFAECADALERAVTATDEAILSLAEAAEVSGYSEDHLRHLVADGAIPNAGRKHKPRVRRGDLPRRAMTRQGTAYDPVADALRLHAVGT